MKYLAEYNKYDFSISIDINNVWKNVSHDKLHLREFLRV